MEKNFWLERWEREEIGFHQNEINPHLRQYWQELHPAHGSEVFVPLCGKSLDMLWLAGQGHEVIGIELSPVAVHDFFHENGLLPEKSQVGPFTLWQHGNLSILCGDFFALDKSHLGPFDTVYDRAALTALPEDIRTLYVAQLERLVPQAATVFLLTTEDAAEGATLAQAVGVDAEIAGLYSARFEIDLAYVESVFEPDPQASGTVRRVEFKVYRLSGKTKPPG